MRRKLTLAALVFAASVLVGSALPQLLPSAHACSCATTPWWTLEGSLVEGDGDTTAEINAWDNRGWFNAYESLDVGDFSTEDARVFEWRRMQ